MSPSPNSYRTECDLLGPRALPANALHGIHTARAAENFPLAGRPVHPELAKAYGAVKLACALTNRALGAWRDNPAKADAIERACREMADGALTEHVTVDALAGQRGHLAQHERQRGAGQPRAANPRRAARQV